MLPAREIEQPALPPTRPRPRVVDDRRPSLEVDKLMATMEVLEGYIDLHLVALERAEAPPAVC